MIEQPTYWLQPFPWPQTPAGINRPCCGAHADGFDRATGSVYLPHETHEKGSS